MEKQFYEQSVCDTAGGRSGILYALCWLLIAVLIMISIFFGANVFGVGADALKVNWSSAIGLVICLALTALVYWRKDYLRMEYDYILNGDALEVYAILNRRRRKRMARIDLSRVESCGPLTGTSMAQNGEKLHKWYLQKENGLHYISYKEESIRHRALLEIDEELTVRLRRNQSLCHCWKDTEGKTSNYASIS